MNIPEETESFLETITFPFRDVHTSLRNATIAGKLILWPLGMALATLFLCIFICLLPLLSLGFVSFTFSEWLDAKIKASRLYRRIHRIFFKQ